MGIDTDYAPLNLWYLQYDLLPIKLAHFMLMRTKDKRIRTKNWLRIIYLTSTMFPYLAV
uniref:Uncharacterized protein n=1 Tax=Providencia rettgeri TaxID=587 RepID=Q8RKZ3_PRORE|nr:hypothetical protein [Providencia rettgeri]